MLPVSKTGVKRLLNHCFCVLFTLDNISGHTYPMIGVFVHDNSRPKRSNRIHCCTSIRLLEIKSSTDKQMMGQKKNPEPSTVRMVQIED